MSKKEYISKILEAVSEYWPLAKGLKILLEGNTLNEWAIDTLADIFSRAIDQVADKETKEKLQKSKEVLEKLKQIENQQHLSDQTSLNELDAMISSI